jgi:hypothetical protein
MRLQLSFLTLLTITTLSTGIIWGMLGAARQGDAASRVVVLALAPVAFVGMLLLSRIVVKARTANRGGRR